MAYGRCSAALDLQRRLLVFARVARGGKAQRPIHQQGIRYGPRRGDAVGVGGEGGMWGGWEGGWRCWSDSITPSAGLTSSSWKRFTEAAGALGGTSATGGVLGGASATGAEPGGACVPPPQAANSALAKTATAMVSRVVFMFAPVSIDMQRRV